MPDIFIVLSLPLASTAEIEDGFIETNKKAAFDGGNQYREPRTRSYFRVLLIFSKDMASLLGKDSFVSVT